ncbi:hypothetical protein D3C73_718800 [compost metagenome]
MQPGIDLNDTQPQRLRNTERRNNHAHNVDNMTDPAVDAVANQRVQQRTKGQRQTFTVGEIRQAQADHGEDRPRVQAPVEQRDAHRQGCRLVRQALGERVVGVVQHGLGDRPENQANAHPGAEQHGNPRGEAELGPVMFGAQFEIAETADGDIKQQTEYATDQGEVIPLEVMQDKHRSHFKSLGCLLIFKCTK